MKKIYMTPQMDVVKIQHNAQLLAGSVIGDTVLPEDAGTDVPGLAPSFELPGVIDLPGFNFDEPSI